MVSFQEAQKLATLVLIADSCNVDAQYIRAVCVYNEDWEQGIRCFEKVISLDPDHAKAKKMLLGLKKFRENEKQGNQLRLR